MYLVISRKTLNELTSYQAHLANDALNNLPQFICRTLEKREALFTLAWASPPDRDKGIVSIFYLKDIWCDLHVS